MNDAFQLLDAAWRFSYMNPQSCAMFECRAEDLAGKVIWDEFPDMARTSFRSEYLRAVRDHVPVRFEQAYEPLGRTLEVRAYPTTEGLAVYLTDVTEQRLVEARLRQTERLEMLGRLTAGVAHDFANYLFVIHSFAGMGQEEAFDEKLAGYFDQIVLASGKASALTRKLRAFGKEQELAPTQVDLNDVVGGLISLLRGLLPKAIELRHELPDEPVYVFVDRSQLEQVILNLVVNARDAIAAEGTIVVRARVGTKDGQCGVLQVTDTGAGMPEDVIQHIFDPFFSTKSAEKGTGLGLATIYGIVTQSGGSIAVDSVVGRGTSMTVSLPAGTA